MYYSLDDPCGEYIKIPLNFIYNYLSSANGSYVKVYLLGLSQCGFEKPMSIKETAKKLGLLESEVLDAWRYFDKEGVVTLEVGIGGEPSVIFNDLSGKKAVQIEQKPSYSAKEISAYIKTDSKIRDLFAICESILQKPLGFNDLSAIYSLYDTLHMPLDTIPLLLSYCVKNGKKSLRYAEKTAINWLENGIDTFEKTENYLKSLDDETKKINAVSSSFGISNRKLSETEVKYIKQWIFEEKFSISLLEKAYDLCIIKTGKLSFPYMNSILHNWKKQGITKGTEVKIDKPGALQKTAVGTKFNNFEQRRNEEKLNDYKNIGYIAKKKD